MYLLLFLVLNLVKVVWILWRGILGRLEFFVFWCFVVGVLFGVFIEVCFLWLGIWFGVLFMCGFGMKLRLVCLFGGGLGFGYWEVLGWLCCGLDDELVVVVLFVVVEVWRVILGWVVR